MAHECEFCSAPLRGEAANIALLDHLGGSPDCREQFVFMIENLQASWTVSMSGP